MHSRSRSRATSVNVKPRPSNVSTRTITTSQSSDSRKVTLEYAEKVLRSRTHFNSEEIKALVHMYHKIAGSHGKLDRMKFREILHSTFDITDDVMLDRVFRTFDFNNDGFVDEIEWIEGLSTILRGTVDERIIFCYYVYDLNGDGSLTREELLHSLKGSVMSWEGVLSMDETEEAVKEIVEIILRKLDYDKDGIVSFTDFKRAIYRDPLLLESVGPCLPPRAAMAGFLGTFTFNYRSYSQDYGGAWKLKAKNHLLWEKIKQNPSLITRHSRTRNSVVEANTNLTRYLYETASRIDHSNVHL